MLFCGERVLQFVTFVVIFRNNGVANLRPPVGVEQGDVQVLHAYTIKRVCRILDDDFDYVSICTKIQLNVVVISVIRLYQCLRRTVDQFLDP